VAILSKFIKSTAKPELDPEVRLYADYPSKWGTKTQSGERVTVDNSMSLATFYRGMNIISDDVAKMPFQQFAKFGKNVDQVSADGSLYNMAYLLQVSPNQWGWTPSQFKKQVIQWQITHGNAYIWKPPVFPPQLLILPANRTLPVFDVDGNLWYQHTFTNGKPAYIPAVEILHLLINPDETGFMGRGVITFARETLGNRLGSRKTQSKMYSNGLTAAAYIQVDAALDEAGRKRIKDAYAESMSGSENAYSLAVLDNKITKFDTITLQPRDAQFLEQIDANETDIANFLGMPLHMLNRGKESYNSNEQKYIEYLQGTLDAYLVPFEEAARIKWLSQREQINQYFKFNRASLLRMDAKTRAETNAIKIQSGQMMPNEARAYDEQSPYPEGDEFWMMSNVQKISGGTNAQQTPN
jgi:HK97 family phage portal protein